MDMGRGEERVRCMEGVTGKLTLPYAKQTANSPIRLCSASLVAQMVKDLPAVQETWVRKSPWRRKRLTTSVFLPGEFYGA